MRTDSGHSVRRRKLPPGSLPWNAWKPRPAGTSAFELLIGELDIPESCWPNHPRVQAFVRANAEHHYIPEELLVRLGIRVRADLI